MLIVDNFINILLGPIQCSVSTMKLQSWTIDTSKDSDIPLKYVLINNHFVLSYLLELTEIDFFMPMGVSEQVIWHLTSSRHGRASKSRTLQVKRAAAAAAGWA